ncbi:hypothetical protein RHMOL_Rhmol07G0187000 [Rhododendron molle]|uniref:Uncharacterized protein n=1 Tax=Rhododendron molle TaxID=49168 RepID=A0ACC0N3U0_RHOML|nr:hypothetical protein RHMOL_Rhmol07G0187000 [Rhododendron molle]
MAEELQFDFVVGNREASQKQKLCTPRVLAYYGLQKLPYKLDALEPYMSQRTLEVHWGEHHRGYLEGLNKQLAKSDILWCEILNSVLKRNIKKSEEDILVPPLLKSAALWEKLKNIAFTACLDAMVD